MTTVVASCPFCGQVELTPDQVTLTVCDTGRASYRFLCPRCFVSVRKPACPHTVSELVRVHVPTETLHVPAEALETHDGPPLCYDDLLDFCAALRGQTRLARWAAAG